MQQSFADELLNSPRERHYLSNVGTLYLFLSQKKNVAEKKEEKKRNVSRSHTEALRPMSMALGITGLYKIRTSVTYLWPQKLAKLRLSVTSLAYLTSLFPNVGRTASVIRTSLPIQGDRVSGVF